MLQSKEYQLSMEVRVSASCYFYMKLMLKRGYVIFFLTLDPSFLLYCLVFHYYSSCINDEIKPTDVHSPGGGRCFASLLFFFFALILSFSAKLSGWAVLHTLPFFALCFMHTCIHRWPVTNTQEPLSAVKKNNNSLTESRHSELQRRNGTLLLPVCRSCK